VTPAGGCPRRHGCSARADGVVEALHELYAPADAEAHEYYDIATPQRARQWLIEDLWTARLME
jgi:hypothetical protein